MEVVVVSGAIDCRSFAFGWLLRGRWPRLAQAESEKMSVSEMTIDEIRRLPGRGESVGFIPFCFAKAQVEAPLGAPIFIALTSQPNQESPRERKVQPLDFGVESIE